MPYFGRLLHLGLGDRMVAGTDAGPGRSPFGSMALCLELMVAGGMTPVEAILSATRVAAEACGLHDVGSIETGNQADLLVVRGDPLQTIQALSDVVAVFKSGVLVRLDDSMMPMTAEQGSTQT